MLNRKSDYKIEDAQTISRFMEIDWETMPFSIGQFCKGLNYSKDGRSIEKAFRFAFDQMFDEQIYKGNVEISEQAANLFQYLYCIEKSGRGEQKPGHRYIRREGTPGNYRYIYETSDQPSSGEAPSIPKLLRQLLVQYKNAKEEGMPPEDLDKLKNKIRNSAKKLKVDIPEKEEQDKALWEMPFDEFADFIRGSIKIDWKDELLMMLHRQIVHDAIAYEGVPVPEEIREEYPEFKDLKKEDRKPEDSDDGDDKKKESGKKKEGDDGE